MKYDKRKKKKDKDSDIENEDDVVTIDKESPKREKWKQSQENVTNERYLEFIIYKKCYKCMISIKYVYIHKWLWNFFGKKKLIKFEYMILHVWKYR